MKERELQKQVIDYLKWALPPLSYVTAIPGGDGRMTRAIGWVSGTPDILVLVNGKRPVLIELKAPNGRKAIAQIASHVALRAAGCVAGFCYSIDHVEALLFEAGIPLKTRIAA